jgi:hypothetical protein
LFAERKALIKEIEEIQRKYADSDEGEFYCWTVELELDKVNNKLEILYDELNELEYEIG